MARKASPARETGPRKRQPHSKGLSHSDKQRLADSALLLLEQVYVHLPLKKAMHSINPVQKLRLLAQEASTLSEGQFHTALLSTFLSLRDLHTNYILPAPTNRYTAILPFRLAEFYHGDERGYVVTDVFQAHAANPAFVRGVIVTHWNGTPIDRAVAVNADREAGSNAAARHARGLEAMTLRWLGMSLPPDEDWVDVTFHSQEKPDTIQTARFNWLVYEEGVDALGVGQAKGTKATALGLDMRAEVERRVRRILISENVLKARLQGRKTTASLSVNSPAVFPRCENITTSSGTFGYIRVATFDVNSDEDFVREFIHLVSQLSQDGLIIDVRGNGGGLVLAGERLLQLLTPRRIEPEKFHFINSKFTLQICKRPDFQSWMESIAQATRIGSEFSSGFPLLSEAECNDIGQVYQGPVVLITDALCYSTTDIFAAGFQDHEIGTIIGVAENTGAGGANVWGYDLLRQFLSGSDSSLKPLPKGAQFRVAIRRTTRVGSRAGQPLEDLGVLPDRLYKMTLRDVLEGNADLIEFAGGILATQPKQRLTADIKTGQHKTRRLSWSVENLDRVDVYVNERPLKSQVMAPGKLKAALSIPASLLNADGMDMIELKGYRKGRLVAATRVKPQHPAT